MQAGQEIAVVTVRLHRCWFVGEEYAPLSGRESGALMTMEPHGPLVRPDMYLDLQTTKNILFDIQAELGDTQKPCSCSEAAVHMLEELELKDYNDTELAADVVLNNQQAALGKLYAWIACERCPTPRATSMLLAPILERLSLSFEKGVSHYARVLQGGGSPDSSESSRGSHRSDLHQQLLAGTGAVGEYPIKMRLEYGQVVRVLLTIQVRKLESAIATLKQRNMLDGMLADAKRRTRRIISELAVPAPSRWMQHCPMITPPWIRPTTSRQ
ncbi:hypothetical protein BDW75DRAFT_246036 [Aspergillus navahoensis]